MLKIWVLSRNTFLLKNSLRNIQASLAWKNKQKYTLHLSRELQELHSDQSIQSIFGELINYLHHSLPAFIQMQNFLHEDCWSLETHQKMALK
jgi:hypothetical protein